MKFCGQPCYQAWKLGRKNSGMFCGKTPWNKGMKGLHLSPETEFKAGRRAPERLEVGTVRVRQRKNREEGPRAWVKTANPNTWRLRAVVVWEAAHGPLPRGMVVHHINRDTMDDKLSNLEAETRAEHLLEHRPEFEAKRVVAAAKAAGQRKRSGTTGLVADQEGRDAILIDLDERNGPMAENRITGAAPLLAQVVRE